MDLRGHFDTNRTDQIEDGFGGPCICGASNLSGNYPPKNFGEITTAVLHRYAVDAEIIPALIRNRHKVMRTLAPLPAATSGSIRKTQTLQPAVY